MENEPTKKRYRVAISFVVEVKEVNDVRAIHAAINESIYTHVDTSTIRNLSAYVKAVLPLEKLAESSGAIAPGENINNGKAIADEQQASDEAAI